MLRDEVFPVDAGQDLTKRLTLAPARRLPLSRLTLGALGRATRVAGPDAFPRVILRQPFGPESLTGIDARTVRVFRVEPRSRSFRPVWDSGINPALGFVWSRIRRPGVYVPLGLPRDRLLSETLRSLARARRKSDAQTREESRELAEQIFGPLLAAGPEVEWLREILTHLEIRTSPGVFLPGEIRLGRGGAPEPFPLPGDIGFQELQQRLAALEIPPAGLPEEQLFFPPESPNDAEPPWLILPPRPLPRPLPLPAPGEPLPAPWPPVSLGLPDDPLRLDERLLQCFEPFTGRTVPATLGWLFPRDWWMHHADAAHLGAARGSAICRTNVGTLSPHVIPVKLDGPIVSMPSIVAGKVYVGSSTRSGGIGGTLYRIALAGGIIEASFSFSGDGARHAPHAGVASSPAVIGGKVYFSALTGKVYCLDAATFACLWVTDLRHTDLPKNQPVDHGVTRANGWSSPLVVNNRVYVGFGEGESCAFGFVYCLDTATGKVIWLFCTNQLAAGVDNSPNVIPPAAFNPLKGPLPAGFTLAAADPPQRGSSPWSAPAYCVLLNRIYIGTGNAIPDDPFPDPRYASGLLSLDATTGELKGFFQPEPADNYRPADDLDVDVPAGPTVFTRGGTRYVCFGSKNGSFFLLDAGTLKVVRRRQLLPYEADDKTKPFPHVDPPQAPGPRENKSGVFGTAAVAAGLGRIFIGLGGYGGAIDSATTPFIRAVDWGTLADAWPTDGGNPPKYSLAEKPVYANEGETGMSSPAVVNDVVFVSTTRPALYAFDAETGLCLWVAPGIAPASNRYALGPAIYGNFVVNGLSNGVLYIYSL
jgi:outer membrane protein assembly factor BamB